jgi:hypothetical protein
MTRRFAGPLFAAAVSAVPAACYDWQVGAGSSDAGNGHDASGVDAHVDHPDANAQAPDAGPSDAQAVSDGTNVVDAAAPADARASCASLAANVDAARAPAQACTLGSTSECTTYVTDPCGCQQFVALSAGMAAATYRMAVQALKAGGCTSGACDGCPPAVTAGLCLETSTGSSVTTACSP